MPPRPHLDPVRAEEAPAVSGEGAKFYSVLHPPLLLALGMQRKLKLGPWFTPAFGVLRRMRRLRGTPLDLFGLPEVRRVERALIGEYRDLVARALEQLRPDTHATVATIAGLPDMVRGYEDVKLGNVERYQRELTRLRRQLGL